MPSPLPAGSTSIDPTRVAELTAAEHELFERTHPRSRELFEEGTNLFGKVPMTWMNKWSGGFPLYLDHARGNRISDVDGHTYVDFALGDTGAQVVCATHSPLLAATPGAGIVQLDGDGFHATTWAELTVVDHWRRYLEDPQRYLIHLLGDD